MIRASFFVARFGRRPDRVHDGGYFDPESLNMVVLATYESENGNNRKQCQCRK